MSPCRPLPQQRAAKAKEHTVVSRSKAGAPRQYQGLLPEVRHLEAASFPLLHV